MRTKILSSLKVLSLALVLSLGIGYAYAWVGPSGAPTGGNVATPINTSSKAQVKAGDLSVVNLTSTGNIDVGGTVSAQDYWIAVTGRYASQGPAPILVESQTQTNIGGNLVYSYAACPSGYTVTGCGGFYSRVCWGNNACEFKGVIFSGNGCSANAWAWDGSDQVLAQAHCQK